MSYPFLNLHPTTSFLVKTPGPGVAVPSNKLVAKPALDRGYPKKVSTLTVYPYAESTDHQPGSVGDYAADIVTPFAETFVLDPIKLNAATPFLSPVLRVPGPIRYREFRVLDLGNGKCGNRRYDTYSGILSGILNVQLFHVLPAPMEKDSTSYRSFNSTLERRIEETKAIATDSLTALPIPTASVDMVIARSLHKGIKVNRKMTLRMNKEVDGKENCIADTLEASYQDVASASASDIEDTLAECFRVLRDGGILEYIFFERRLCNAGPLAQEFETAWDIDYNCDLSTGQFVAALERAGFAGESPGTMPKQTPCDACALRRVKCDACNPCTWCLKHEQPCTYLRVRRRRGPKGPRPSTIMRVTEQRTLSPRTDPDYSYLASSPVASSSTSTIAVGAAATQASSAPGYMGRIPLSQYFTYLDMFQSKLYAIWPVVAAEDLKARLCDETHIEPDVHALAAALSAATILQLRLLDEESDSGGSAAPTSEAFVRECLRHRNTLTSSNTISTNLLLISLFLHMYYANTEQIHAATFALRDAITYIHLLRLDDEDTLDSLPVEEREVGIRIFWVLFVTERTFCSTHGIPILLQKISYLPDPTREMNYGICSITGFCCLVRLFTLAESILPSKTKAIERPQEKGELQLLYQDITANSVAMVQDQGSVSLGMGMMNMVTLQEVDIQTTRAWLQSLLWQRALSNFLLDSHAREAQFTPEFPLTLAKGLLGFLSRIPLESIRPHAYAMEVKLTQVAHTLLDIIMIVPSIRRARCTPSSGGPVDVVLALEKLLRSLFRRESETVAAMRRRLSEVDFGPVGLAGVELGLLQCSMEACTDVLAVGEAELQRGSGQQEQKCESGEGGEVWWEDQSLSGLELEHGPFEFGGKAMEGENEWYEL
ncbi:hypothetical protein BJY01DRAFT_245780 [Aspergillus pseudoustus]|uniref:Zn(2)-C6 fungal-type domain-containing protein n=1 Tax=Aspergillus pseudoustus TaxID=1810923 RepID=A0ABR4KCS9_9EURO